MSSEISLKRFITEERKAYLSFTAFSEWIWKSFKSILDLIKHIFYFVL